MAQNTKAKYGLAVRYAPAYFVKCLALVYAVIGISSCSVTPEKKPIFSPPQIAASVKKMLAPNIFLNIKHGDTAFILRSLARLAGKKLVLDPTIKGTISYRAENVAPLTAIKAIAGIAKLDFHYRGSIIWVHTPLTQADFRIAHIPLKYYNTNDVVKPLGMKPNGSSIFLSEKGRITLDKATNQVIVKAKPEAIKVVKTILGWLDTPRRQVEIDVKIVEADDNFSRNLGTRIGYGKVGSKTTTKKAPGVELRSGLAALPISGTLAASGATTLFSSQAMQYLNVEISALEESGMGRVLSHPRVITFDRTEALVEQGTELPYQLGGQNGTVSSVVFRKANLKLAVLPKITPQNSIILDVDISKDTVGAQTKFGFAINKKHIKTQVVVENRGTVMLGGIATESEINVTTKVPLLSSIPWLGSLFKRKEKKKVRGELLIFITPKIIK